MWGFSSIFSTNIKCGDGKWQVENIYAENRLVLVRYGKGDWEKCLDYEFLGVFLYILLSRFNFRFLNSLINKKKKNWNVHSSKNLNKQIINLIIFIVKLMKITGCQWPKRKTD